MKKATEETTREIEELVVLDAHGQPHSIYRKRIAGIK
jgi:hypothetical protein